jgi:membrane-associated PAP2 superfamily phosphatase
MSRWQPSSGVLYLFAATVALAALGRMLPHADINLIRPLFVGETRFLLDGHPLNETYKAIRSTIAFLFMLGLLSFSAAAASGRPLCGMTARRLYVLWGTLVIGVVLIANLLLKQGFNRPRPEDSDVFGGALPYMPPWTFGGACDHNCSFVSGDVSFVFIGTVFALWTPPGWPRRLAMGALLAIGLCTGVMRMLTGNHFPSDILFAALVTAMVAVALNDALLVQRVPLPALPPRIALWTDRLALRMTLARIRLTRIAARWRARR